MGKVKQHVGLTVSREGGVDSSDDSETMVQLVRTECKIVQECGCEKSSKSVQLRTFPWTSMGPTVTLSHINQQCKFHIPKYCWCVIPQKQYHWIHRTQDIEQAFAFDSHFLAGCRAYPAQNVILACLTSYSRRRPLWKE